MSLVTPKGGAKHELMSNSLVLCKKRMKKDENGGTNFNLPSHKILNDNFFFFFLK
jgi:hypothetical protein